MQIVGAGCVAAKCTNVNCGCTNAYPPGDLSGCGSDYPVKGCSAGAVGFMSESGSFNHWRAPLIVPLFSHVLPINCNVQLFWGLYCNMESVELAIARVKNVSAPLREV